MSISDKIQALEASRQAIATAITQKGGTVAQGDGFSQFATEISNLPSGGSGNKLLTSIDVSEFSGTDFKQVAQYITNATIPSGVTNLGTFAFQNCSSLASVTIPNSVTSIGQSAFKGCSSLTSVTIPNSVTSFGNETFANCSNLTSVTISNTATSLGEQMFSYCSSLTNIVIPNSVTNIKQFALRGCSSLTNIVIPNNVTTIGWGSFNDCSGLTYIVCLPTTPPTMTNVAFTNTNNCPIYVPAESVDAYKAATNWSNYASRIYPITQVATVDGNPVYNYDLRMTSTDTITSENMEKMPAGTSVEFAEGLTNIATGEINYQEVILPSTFTGFGDSDMIGSSVTTITSNAVTPPSAFRNKLGGSGLTAIYVPSSSVDTYKAHAAWTSFSSIIQAIPAE